MAGYGKPEYGKPEYGKPEYRAGVRITRSSMGYEKYKHYIYIL